MTQQPQYGYYPPTPYRDPLAPARRASTMLFILGILMAAFGLCNLVSVAGHAWRLILGTGPQI